MEKKTAINSEEKLIELLSTMHRDPAYRDDFEERFLDEMYRRRSQEIVRKPVTELLKEQIHAYLQNFGGWKWAYAAMGATTVLLLAFIVMLGNSNTYNEEGGMNSGSIFDLNEVGPSLRPVSTEIGIPIESANPEKDKNVVPVSRQLIEL